MLVSWIFVTALLSTFSCVTSKTRGSFEDGRLRRNGGSRRSLMSMGKGSQNMINFNVRPTYTVEISPEMEAIFGRQPPATMNLFEPSGFCIPWNAPAVARKRLDNVTGDDEDWEYGCRFEDGPWGCDGCCVNGPVLMCLYDNEVTGTCICNHNTRTPPRTDFSLSDIDPNFDPDTHCRNDFQFTGPGWLQWSEFVSDGTMGTPCNGPNQCTPGFCCTEFCVCANATEAASECLVDPSPPITNLPEPGQGQGGQGQGSQGQGQSPPATPPGTCSTNPGCSVLALEGNCCPTDNGPFLSCCDEAPLPGTCFSNQACNALGLQGECCPTVYGTSLDCCDEGGNFDYIGPLQSCSFHPRCTALGLRGTCCPQLDGTDLDCCNGSPVDRSCSANPGCAGLEGECCPTLNGDFLDCCDGPPPNNPPPIIDPDDGGALRRSCSLNPRCTALGLEGVCCPTLDGSSLECCGQGDGFGQGQGQMIQSQGQGQIQGQGQGQIQGQGQGQIQGQGQGQIQGQGQGQIQGQGQGQIQSQGQGQTQGQGQGQIQGQATLGSCSLHPGCAVLGLEGDCCPTQNGPFLSCCNDSPAPGTCFDNQACNGLGLRGECCPTVFGTFLDCCDQGGNSDYIGPLQACSFHPSCAALGISGTCCPTLEGTDLGCCNESPLLRSCSANPRCVGLEGECCPTLNGDFLDCCDGLSSISNLPPPAFEPDDALRRSCSLNPLCTSLGLEGVCCPTLQGTYLDCCES